MKDIILKAENISKQYRLGTVGSGTLSHDLNRWWHAVRGKEDPYLTVGALNDRSAAANEEYVWALQDINFEVRKGEVLGIIGKNGAGKSTLLKILSRVTSPTTGSIKTRGRIASLLEVGTGFHPELTGRENIYLNGAILGMTKPEIASKIDEIIEFSGCEMYIDTPTKRYSSGMTVRLAFAVAAHLEPEILVIDEVLAVGDAEFQKKAIGKMQDISKGGNRTVLFVSHNMVSVESLCTRCVLLEHGKTAFEGDVRETIARYRANASQTDGWDFESMEGRSGSGALRFSGISYNENQDVICGEDLRIEISMKSDLAIKDVKFALSFCINQDQRILIVDNLTQGIQLDVKEGLNKMQITIPNFNLMPNDYTINLWAEADRVVLDYIVEKISLKVEPKDYYGTGRMLNSTKHGIVIPEKCIWELR